MAAPAARPGPLAAGSKLARRFRLQAMIAVGGMGEVWRGTDDVLRRPVAIKLLRAELVESSLFLARFRSEAQHAGALSHPNVAHVYDYGEERHGDRLIAYLVMELVDGRPLSELIAERRPLEVPVAVSILHQTAAGLQAAHARGIVHRDIKPGNVLVTADQQVKITDFGIARAAASPSITEVGQVIGTARYMSPEQALGLDVGPASDIYSLGVVAYEMLSGRVPFDGDTAAAIALAHVQAMPPPLPATVPKDLAALVIRSLSKDPLQRPGNGDVFGRALSAASTTSTKSSPSALAPAQRGAAELAPAGVASAQRAADELAPAGSPPGEAAPDELAPTEPMNVAVLRSHEPAADGSLVVDAAGAAVDQATTVSPTASSTSLPILPRQPRPQHRWRAITALVAVVAALVVGLVLIDQRVSDTQSSGAPATTTAAANDSAVTASPTPIVLDPATYIGMTQNDADAALRQQGFVVQPVSYPSTPDHAGLVIAVDPSGPLLFGATVHLVVGDGAAPVATSTAATVVEAVITPGKGNGGKNGKGGKGKDG